MSCLLTEMHEHTSPVWQTHLIVHWHLYGITNEVFGLENIYSQFKVNTDQGSLI